MAKQHGAKFKQVVGDELLKQNFPAIHAVGRASHRAPRLIELNWSGVPAKSSAKAPLLSIVGKGVCFDTGGLNIKGGEGMRQMKKDMGGAANALGQAALVMAMKLPVRLQVLIPAVEKENTTTGTSGARLRKASRASSSVWPGKPRSSIARRGVQPASITA